MKNILFITTLLTFIALAQAKQMNVILIMADDLGYECLSSYGGESYKTPHLDRLSAGGMTFLNAHSQPICTPSRVQIMTGKYNVKNYKKFAYLDPNEKTFAHYFKDAGYKTCMVGKWQLAGGIDAPYHFGFDEYSLWRIMKNDNQSRYPNPGIVENGEFKNYQNGEYGPDRMNQFALKFIEDNKDKAFMLYYSMLLVHNPFEPTPDSEDWDPEAIGLDNLKGGFKGKDNAKYFSDMMSYMDKQVGRLVATLERLGLRENTLIIFTGDNGTTRGITSLCQGNEIQGGKGLTSDAGTHVPLIVNGPSYVLKGVKNSNFVDFSDILPTICEATEISIPTEELDDLDGLSFLPQLKGQKSQVREWVYCWYQKRTDASKVIQFVMNKDYKLYASGTFFNLQKDILEKNRLKYDKLSPEVKKIRQQLKQVLKKYQDL